jgi:hypothetical protein
MNLYNLFGNFNVSNANETSFVAQCVEAIAFLVTIEANVIDMELIPELYGRCTETFRLLVTISL